MLDKSHCRLADGVVKSEELGEFWESESGNEKKKRADEQKRKNKNKREEERKQTEEEHCIGTHTFDKSNITLETQDPKIEESRNLFIDLCLTTKSIIMNTHH